MIPTEWQRAPLEEPIAALSIGLAALLRLLQHDPGGLVAADRTGRGGSLAIGELLYEPARCLPELLVLLLLPGMRFLKESAFFVADVAWARERSARIRAGDGGVRLGQVV